MNDSKVIRGKRGLLRRGVRVNYSRVQFSFPWKGRKGWISDEKPGKSHFEETWFLKKQAPLNFLLVVYNTAFVI